MMILDRNGTLKPSPSSIRFFVMAGLRPGHPRPSCLSAAKTWMPGTRPGMTSFANILRRPQRGRLQNERASRWGAGRTGAARLYSTPKSVHLPDSLTGSLGRGGLVRHVHDLDAAVDFRQRVGRVLELALAVSDGHEIGAGNAELVGQIALDRVGAPFGQILIVGLATGGVGMTRDDEGRALQIGIGQRLAEGLNRGLRFCADIGRVVIEGDFQIDIRLVLGNGGDLFALDYRERTRGPVTDGLDETSLRGNRRRIG